MRDPGGASQTRGSGCLATPVLGVPAYLVAHLARDTGPHASTLGLGDQVLDLVGSQHRKVLRRGSTRGASARIRLRSKRGTPRTHGQGPPGARLPSAPNRRARPRVVASAPSRLPRQPHQPPNTAPWGPEKRASLQRGAKKNPATLGQKGLAGRRALASCRHPLRAARTAQAPCRGAALPGKELSAFGKTVFRVPRGKPGRTHSEST